MRKVNKSGFRCPTCRTPMFVIDSRRVMLSPILPAESIYRRRVCRNCGTRRSTYEVTKDTIVNLMALIRNYNVTAAAVRQAVLLSQVQHEALLRISKKRQSPNDSTKDDSE